MHQFSTMLGNFFRNFSKSVISSLYPYQYEIPLKLIALVCLMSLEPVLRSLVKRKVKTENCISTFPVAGVVNTEIFMSFIKHPFYKQTG